MYVCSVFLWRVFVYYSRQNLIVQKCAFSQSKLTSLKISARKLLFVRLRSNKKSSSNHYYQVSQRTIIFLRYRRIVYTRFELHNKHFWCAWTINPVLKNTNQSRTPERLDIYFQDRKTNKLLFVCKTSYQPVFLFTQSLPDITSKLIIGSHIDSSVFS